MSLVTNVMIITPAGLNPEMFTGDDVSDTINADLKAAERFAKVDLADAGGYKHMEVDVYACAFNYANKENLKTWFRGLEWVRGDDAIMIITNQWGEIETVRVENGVVQDG